MKRATKKTRSANSPKTQRQTRPRSYTPVSDALKERFTFADTELAEGISRHGLVGLLNAAISRKRRRDGEPLGNVLCALLVWPLLSLKSIHCFCAQLGQILQGKVSVLYDFLGREDVNWRGLNTQLARRVSQQNDLGPRSQCALVVDDTTQARAGRKVQGTSRHFDHTQGKSIQGHQVLQLGWVGTKGFVPVEAQLVMSDVNPVEKPQDKPFRDQRSAAARDMRRSWEQTKQELFRAMLHRAIQAGWRAVYLLADAWFGCKENIALSLELGLTGIFQMKRGNLSYRDAGRDYTTRELYAKVQRRMKPAQRKARFKTASLTVRLNLQTQRNQPEKWVPIRLIFSAPVRACSADTWVVFVCTDLTLSDAKVLQAYALRWSIEVYFKEIKQNLGFLKEQSGRYQVAYASVHLAALRYLLLLEAMLRSGRLSYGEIRDRQSGQLQVLTYATLLWELFRALIEGALEGLIRDLGLKVVRKVAAAIDQTVESFLTQALQMKPDQVAVQLEAEELGYL
ncbi:MAG: transposase [Actinomycetota bacterium]